jgi:hypothetical protein
LKIEHNGKQNFRFPDSTYDFSPFQLIDIEYFATQTVNDISTDSVIYTLKTFVVDSIFKIKLPIEILKSQKKVFSSEATILLKTAITKKDLNNPEIKKTTGYFVVETDFNYPKVFYYLIILILSIFVFWLLFGRLIIKNVRIWRFKFKHQEFQKTYKKLTRKVETSQKLSDILVIWKNHLQWLTRKPISAMSSQEISKLIEKPRLLEALKELDMAIYGGKKSKDLHIPFMILYDITNEAFKNSFETFKNNLKNS